MRLVTFILASLAFLPIACAWSNNECLAQLKAGEFGDVGLDSSGRRVHWENATAMPYVVCRDKCEDGRGQEPFNWSVFSKQFSSWLLPWLALISQLPFGAKYRLDNVIAMLLTIGSPVLAAYSLILTVLNGYHVARRFSGMTYPNTYYAVKILAGLQQSPLHLSEEDGLLASLIVLPQNEGWWPLMTKLIHYEHTWSIAAFASIAWVVVAYMLTVIDSFADVTEAINANGQAVGSLWLWLLPIVIGWLQISPKCDSDRLQAALTDANRNVSIATSDGGVVQARLPESRIGKRRAFMFLQRHELASPDEGCTSPIFNYARALPWARNVETLASAFHHASEHAEHKVPVNSDAEWKLENDGRVHSETRIGTRDQIMAYCAPSRPWTTRWPSSLIAVTLQWCTVGGAVMIVWYTPTTGLGCRSGAYLLYAINSTVIWAVMLMSSVLAHLASDENGRRPQGNTCHRENVAGFLSSCLRRIGKIMAALNSTWIIAVCIFQFSNVFDRCYCNSSVLGRGVKEAFNVMQLVHSDQTNLVHYWIGGVALALVSAFAFVGFVQIYIDPPMPSSTEH
ncbi:hypothetical protein BDZ89DRAFT_1201941 [Hymenopellis radicata]|nr:hypothetical protein BDZ89DRAFT_1201941 [Hymenopellis radicata]